MTPPPEEAESAVALVAEARRTREFSRRLHRAVLVMWGVLGAVHYHPSFARRWRGFRFGVLDAESLFQNLWGSLLVLLVALRADYPLNLLGITFAAFYFGFVSGAHAVL